MKDRNLALIVDDSELNRSMLADILSDEYDIIEAENRLEAISQFENAPVRYLPRAARHT